MVGLLAQWLAAGRTPLSLLSPTVFPACPLPACFHLLCFHLLPPFPTLTYLFAHTRTLPPTLAPAWPPPQKYAGLQEQLEALPAQRELVSRQQELQAAISGLESDMQLLQVGWARGGAMARSLRSLQPARQCPPYIKYHTQRGLAAHSKRTRGCAYGCFTASRAALLPDASVGVRCPQVDRKSSEGKSKGAAKDIQALSKVGWPGWR